ncbi:MAG: hypothetical protein WAL71_04975, partial [Terriglobales bacterium]
MQLVNDAPIANSKPIAIASLELGDIVVSAIRVNGNFFDLFHNPLLPVHGDPRKLLREGFCGNNLVHYPIVTLGNT